MLIVFGGLPGVGKTTLARLLAAELRAVFLRIDAIEQALRDTRRVPGDMADTGYRAAYALARENLRLGLDVVADSVNPIGLTRRAWRATARAEGAACAEVEVVCSDLAEHRRRVEMRQPDIPGLIPPDWRQVLARTYEPLDGPRIRIDTAGRDAAQAFAELRRALRAHPGAGDTP